MSPLIAPPLLAKSIGLWILTIGTGVIMMLAGSGKLTGGAPWPALFQGWGYPTWLRIVTGVAQVAGGFALFVPRVAAYGAGVLVLVMIGAMVTEIVREPEFGPLMPAAFGLASLLIFLGRRRTAVGFLGRAVRAEPEA